MPPIFAFSFRNVEKVVNVACAEPTNQAWESTVLEADEVIAKAKHALGMMEAYSGSLALVQKCISTPNNAQLKKDALAALAPNVDTIRALYDLSVEIEPIFSQLLQLCSQKESKKSSSLLMERLANLVEYAVCFDRLKLSKPAIQNDLSHFRRLMAVNTTSNQLERFADIPLNILSFFVADQCPMLKVLIRAIESTLKQDPNVICVLAQLANECCVSCHRIKEHCRALHNLRAMTGAILLYDHTSSGGAFRSRSDIKIKRCLKELVQWTESSQGRATELLSTIRFSSRHFNDPTTPEKIRALVEKHC